MSTGETEAALFVSVGTVEINVPRKLLLLSKRSCVTLIWESNRKRKERTGRPYLLCAVRKKMGEKKDVWQGTLALMVLKTLDVLGPQHGYGIARRIEQISENLLAVNQGTLYPALLRLEQRGWIASKWGISENNRRAKYYTLTAKGRRTLSAETERWANQTAAIARILEAKAGA